MSIFEYDEERTLAEFREDGREEGLEGGIEIGGLRMLFGLVKDGILTVEQAAKRVDMTIDEFKTETGLKA